MSEKTLDSLIDRLKTEAIEKAEKTAQSIISDAQTKAEGIVKNAEAKKMQLLKDAEKEAEDIIHIGENALRQASRDICISLQNEMLRILGKVLDKEIRQTFTPDLIRSTVLQVINNVGGPSEIHLPASIKDELAEYIRLKLQTSEEMVTISGDESLINAFTISKGQEGWKYVISAGEIAALLYAYVAPKWKAVLNDNKIA